MTTDTSFFRCLACSAARVARDPRCWRCDACGTEYPLVNDIPMLVRDWTTHEAQLAAARAQHADWYVTEQSSEEASPFRHHLRRRRAYVEQALTRHLARSARTRATTLLDLGCGDGQHLTFLPRYAERVFASDYNALRLTRARARHADVTFFLADVLDYPAHDDFFDVVFLNHVIEHIRDDARALAETFRILRPGGLLVLGTPNEGSWWWQLAFRLEPAMLRATDHVHFYTAETITARMTVAGFRTLDVEHLGWGPPHWTWDRRLRRLKPLDDLFTAIGRRVLPRQASSLYVLATKSR